MWRLMPRTFRGVETGSASDGYLLDWGGVLLMTGDNIEHGSFGRATGSVVYTRSSRERILAHQVSLRLNTSVAAYAVATPGLQGRRRLRFGRAQIPKKAYLACTRKRRARFNCRDAALVTYVTPRSSLLETYTAHAFLSLRITITLEYLTYY